MTNESSSPTRFVVVPAKLPKQFPTHAHQPEFWCALGRVVATYGFLEEVLAKAIFTFTGTRTYDASEIEAELKKWLKTLEGALSGTLGQLIGEYDKAVRSNPSSTLENLDELVRDLRTAAEVRNVVCHGSWRLPNEAGESLPFFVNRKMLVFDTLIDAAYLEKLQIHVVELCCAVINSVTHMGFQFPGSSGPGNSVM